MARCVMIQGTMSGAGKSLLVTALCRIFREDGYRVAPFKSQNMALNSYITKDGLEMGRAQAAQAEAAGIEPDVRMNPILLKPTSDVGSQVIINGKVRGTFRARDYFKMKTTLIPDILKAYHSLAAENDIIVIEGAGSPAEINLKKDDIVNMGIAKLVNAPVILVGDIDPGGVFAQLYGTIALLDDDERARIAGTVINKFRGDVEILRPGLKMIEELTKVPCLGVVPYMDIDIDDEDSISSRLSTRNHEKPIDIAIIRFPKISNFTDFAPLEEHPALGVRYVGKRDELGIPDLIILPGTKSTISDLKWIRMNGMESLIIEQAEAGTPILGVCGGYQMLGLRLEDPLGLECGSDQPRGDSPAVSVKEQDGEFLNGMGLLPVVTVFDKDKCTTRSTGYITDGPWKGVRLDGYEIHMGRTYPANDDLRKFDDMLAPQEIEGRPFVELDNGRPDGWQIGNVYGTYLHGLFDDGELTDALADYLMRRKGVNPGNFHTENREKYRERQYRKLADTVRKSLAMDEIYHMMEGQ